MSKSYTNKFIDMEVDYSSSQNPGGDYDFELTIDFYLEKECTFEVFGCKYTIDRLRYHEDDCGDPEFWYMSGNDFEWGANWRGSIFYIQPDLKLRAIMWVKREEAKGNKGKMRNLSVADDMREYVHEKISEGNPWP